MRSLQSEDPFDLCEYALSCLPGRSGHGICSLSALGSPGLSGAGIPERADLGWVRRDAVAPKLSVAKGFSRQWW
jgi:hypothetical protein